MYKHVMVPVDLAHPEALRGALDVAADIGGLYEASVCLVGVTSTMPSEAARSPSDFRERFNAFAGEQGAARGARFETHVVESNDPATDLDRALLKAADELHADLVVMASHVPSWRDRLIGSHGGWLASHSSLSVFIVR